MPSALTSVRFPNIVMVALAAGLAAPAWADGPAAPAQPGVLMLRTGVVDTAGLANLLVGGAGAALDAERAYVLTFDGAMTPERRAELDAAGVRLADFLPTDSFVAFVDPARTAALARVSGLRGVFAFDAAWKVSPVLGAIAASTPEHQAVAARGKIAVTIAIFDGLTPGATLKALQAVPGFELFSMSDEGGPWQITAAMTRASVLTAAAIPGVQMIEDAPEITLRNNTVRWIVQSNLSSQTPLYNNGLTGVGEIIGVIDGMVEINHCSFLDAVNPVGPLHRKVVAMNGGMSPNAHGTHVAGTALGDAGVNNDTRGVAYGARMVYNYFPSLSESGVFNRFNLHRTQGAFIHSNSWGNENTNLYDVTARAMDNFQWQYDDNLIVLAVSDGTLIRNPENAKNLLAVSASGDAGSQSNYCDGGRGPTIDGRRKPEIMAPGCGILSADYLSSCGVVANSGTSMACPAVSGVAALMRQYFELGYYPTGAANAANAFHPSGALVKAALINSAADMTGISGFPNVSEGWGRVLADNTLYFPGDSRKLMVAQARNSAAGALQTGQSYVLRFRVTNSAIPLKATLAYHDAPASVNASLAPVNNLDLDATPLGGPTYLGNIFVNGVSANGGTPDAINNLEQVLFNAPQPGAWLIRVQAPAVNVGPQGFGLVVSGPIEALCPADFNGDGFVDFFDYDSFVIAFEVGDLFADFNGDGFTDFFDYDDYVTAFETGC